MSILYRIKDEVLKERHMMEERYRQHAEKIKSFIGDKRILYYFSVVDLTNSLEPTSEDYISFTYDEDTLMKKDLTPINSDTFVGYQQIYKPKFIEDYIEKYCFTKYVIHIYKYEIQ